MATHNSASNGTCLSIDGGTSRAGPTYIGSCDSSGAYKVGWAIIDPANPVGGAVPVGAFATVMGQAQYGSSFPPHVGYVTIDGLVVRNFNYAAIIFGDVQSSAIYGVSVLNCKLYNGICANGDENCGALFWVTATSPSLPTILSSTAPPRPAATTRGIWQGSRSTIDRIERGLRWHLHQQYDQRLRLWHQQQRQLSVWHLYLQLHRLRSVRQRDKYNLCAALKSCVPGSGETLIAHHNILIGFCYWGWGADSKHSQGAMTFYNKPSYTPPAVSNKGVAAWPYVDAPFGPFIWYNNVVYFNAYKPMSAVRPERSGSAAAHTDERRELRLQLLRHRHDLWHRCGKLQHGLVARLGL